MVATTMTRWSEARTFYSFFMCFGLVLYWMILDLYLTYDELDVLLQSFCNILNLELFLEAPRSWRQPKQPLYKKNYTIHSLVNRCFYPCGTYIRRLTDEPISHVAPQSRPTWPTFLS
jgi:hypothetical protein